MNSNKSKEQCSELATTKKRATTNIATSTSDATLVASIDVCKRAKFDISSLYESFPETESALDEVEEVAQNNKDAMLNEEEIVPLYSLPDEVLQNCLSFVGNGHYGVVGLVSKKLHRIYTFEYRWMTKYLAVATSVNVVNYCLDNLCKYPEERKNMLKAAAVYGNLDVLRALVKDGYDLSLLVEIKNCTIYNANGNYFDENELEFGVDDCNEEDWEEYWEEYEINFYYTDECDYQPSYTIKLSQIVARGHLHVLKFLHEELNYEWGLQRYCKPAIKYGQLEILKWLNEIGCMQVDEDLHDLYYDPYKREFHRFSFDDYAVKCGNVQSLEWLSNNGFHTCPNLSDAIRSNSLEMIQYCFRKRSYEYYVYKRDAIKASRNIEVYLLLHELGFEFKGTMKDWINSDCSDSFDIIKFLRSISISWDDQIMNNIVIFGTLEMIKYAHENGCPWTSRGDEYNGLFRHGGGSAIDKFKYLISNGCKFDHDKFWVIPIEHLMKFFCKQKDLALLELVVGKNSSFDQQLSKYCYGELWNEGVFYILQNGKKHTPSAP